MRRLGTAGPGVVKNRLTAHLLGSVTGVDWGTVWTTLLTAVVAAVVAWIVSLLQRGREDRKEWRVIRHKRYTEVLTHVHEARDVALVLILIAASSRPPDAEQQGYLTRMSAAIEAIGEDSNAIRLMGHGKIYDHLSVLHLMCQSALSVATDKPDDAKSFAEDSNRSIRQLTPFVEL